MAPGVIANLTHWGRVTHICVSNLTITGSDNGLSPGRRQAIIWTNAGILLIGPLGTNFSEILIDINTFKKMRLKMSSAKWRPFCLGLNELMCSCHKTVNENQGIHTYTETKMSSFWWNFHHWLHWKLSFWQLSVQPVMKISSKWRHFRFSVQMSLTTSISSFADSSKAFDNVDSEVEPCNVWCQCSHCRSASCFAPINKKICFKHKLLHYLAMERPVTIEGT